MYTKDSSEPKGIEYGNNSRANLQQSLANITNNNNNNNNTNNKLDRRQVPESKSCF